MKTAFVVNVAILCLLAGRLGANNPHPDCLVKHLYGNCQSYYDRYFYNSYTRQCEAFRHWNCDENRNNFLSKEECCQKCDLNWCAKKQNA
ncbi:kappaPI-actitoxin-Avd3c-like [Centruroides sculpturatus]|uniref:kappaPI-actitoxin-Avd3c-like n=1 Tax=Centruroides sculpturatus TaxID=218467 RepID=UPI000C6EEB1D|nr:kappaPI-actitoxin-Avd3c-like [Centruroides sculpturatus]